MAVAEKIAPVGGEGRTRRWSIDGGQTVTIDGAESFVRETGDGFAELLIKVPLRMTGREGAMYEGVFEVEMGW